MTFLLDPQRPRLTQPARRAAATALRLVTAAAWRTLHPSAREPFVEAPRPPPLPRVHVETDDGWVLPVFRMDPAPGGSGEPVLLVHSIAGSADAFRYGNEALAHALCRAGFSVYLATHRGDRDAMAPVGGGAASVAHIATRDLPRALLEVLRHSGASSAHVLGFGLGALLAMELGARMVHEVASVTALAPPLRLPAVSTEARGVQLALQLLPSHWAVPLRTMARLGVPLIEGGPCPGERVRGTLAYATDDVPVAVAQELMSWIRSGRPEVIPHVDFEASLGAAKAPLHVMTGSADTVALPGSSEAAMAAWGAAADHTRIDDHGHLDLLLGREVAEQVHGPLVAWLSRHRARSWGEVESVA